VFCKHAHNRCLPVRLCFSACWTLTLPAPLLDELAAGLVECRAKRLVGPALQLDHFLDAMLRRWVLCCVWSVVCLWGRGTGNGVDTAAHRTQQQRVGQLTAV
jgi:hypothetical protein